MTPGDLPPLNADRPTVLGVRLDVLGLALALVLVACGGTSDTTSTAPAGTASTPTSAVSDTTVPEETEATTSTSAAETTGTTSDRPLAPDFSLELGDGGTYTLSEGSKPVYLVFWAEW